MAKQNLVIVHSFPTNSILLEGLYAFLADHFTVYPVDLPGFLPHKKPLKEISFDNYARHVEEQIDQWNLKHYLLGGVSFGFTVVNHCQADERCKGFIALEPFINKHYLKKQFANLWLQPMLACVNRLNMHERFYYSKLFQRYLHANAPSHRITLMQKTIDPYTFFETTRMLLHYEEEPTFHDKPYAVVINDKDNTICGSKTINLFKSLDRALIIKTTLEHHPANPSKQYFQRKIKRADIENIIRFMDT